MADKTARQHATATGDAATRQMVDLLCTPYMGWYGAINEAGGGPIDAPRCIAAGSCNSTEWVSGNGTPRAYITTVDR